MTATPAEFVTSLGGAFPGAVAAGADWAEVRRDAVCLRFDFAVGEPLRIGSLALPRMEVAISVLAGDAAAAECLLAEVDRATQRGGG